MMGMGHRLLKKKKEKKNSIKKIYKNLVGKTITETIIYIDDDV
jgi:hypothetical protein